MRSDAEAFARSLRTTARFVYRNSYWLVPISLGWWLLSITVVGVGPATLGAYVAIMGLRSDRNRIELDRVVTVCRHQLVPAVALGALPVVFLAIASLYLVALAREATPLRVVAFLTALYASVYLSLVLMPGFVALARGHSALAALRTGVAWVGDNTTTALLTGLVTLALLAVTAVLTVAVVLLFPGVAFAFQVTVVDEDVGRDQLPSWE